MSQLRIGIIGSGVMGQGHGEFIRDHVPTARVSALADVDADRIRKVGREIGENVAVFNSASELMSSGLVDAVIIASPDSLHVAHLRLAMEARLPTLCEKPIASNVEDARKIAAEIDALETTLRKRIIHFGFMRRFDPPHVQLKEMLNSGRYGAPLFIRSSTRNVSSPGITTEGLYTNIAVHDFDIWRWILGDEWISVMSHYPKPSSLSPEGLADPLVFTAKLAGGVLMVADVVANNNYGYDLRTEVVCEHGSLEIGIFGDVITRANHVAEIALGGVMVDNWIPRFKDAYIAELRMWTASVISGESHPDMALSGDALAATEACALGLASMY